MNVVALRLVERSIESRLFLVRTGDGETARSLQDISMLMPQDPVKRSGRHFETDQMSLDRRAFGQRDRLAPVRYTNVLRPGARRDHHRGIIARLDFAHGLAFEN